MRKPAKKTPEEEDLPEPEVPLQPTAYSYVRFSDLSQSEGDSLRRQTAKTAEWCQRNGFHLDTSLRVCSKSWRAGGVSPLLAPENRGLTPPARQLLEQTLKPDEGVLAFKGRHRGDKHSLGQFLKLIERGRIPRGSYLVIENLDRLSREDERTALRLWMDILDAGVNIVQLFPETVFRHEKSDLLDVMRAIIELSRGHSESVAKSERLGAAWENKRNGAREGKMMTHRLPAWIEERDGKLYLIPERAAALQRIVQLAAVGHGDVLIVKKLRAEGFPPFGEKVVRKGRKRSAFAGDWTRSYVAAILRDRRVIGELQPRLQDGTPDGGPIPNYYPPAVSEADWQRARRARESQGRTPGRTVAGAVNLWSGLLRDARSGASYFSVLRNKPRGGYYRVLSNRTAHEGTSAYYAFPAVPFERAVLSMLREIDPHEILNGNSEPDDSLALGAEWSRLESSIAAINADMDEHGESPALFKRLREKEARQRAVVKLLDEASKKAAHPLSETWGEAQTLLSVLESAPDRDEARLRLRAALRRIIDEIWLLVMPRGSQRLAAVQIWFAGGEKHRDYLILHRPPRANASLRTPASLKAASSADVEALGPLDLRKPAGAAKVEALLSAVDVKTLAAAMRDIA